jgi:hypothetical protein
MVQKSKYSVFRRTHSHLSSRRFVGGHKIPTNLLLGKSVIYSMPAPSCSELNIHTNLEELRRTGTRNRSAMPGQASQLGRRGREPSVPGGEGGVGGIGARNPRVAPSLRSIRVRDDDDDDDVFQFQQTLRRMPDDAPEPLIITCCNRRGGCGKTTNSTALAMSFAFRGYDVLFVDMDPQTDASQFLLAEKLEDNLARFNNKVKEIKSAKILSGQDRAVAQRDAIEEAKTAEPYGYPPIIDRKRIPDNDDGSKVRTVWESMENFQRIGTKSEAKKIEPMEILAAENGKNGRLLLVPGHEDMTQMEGKIHAGEAAGTNDLNVAWLTIPHHVLKQTAVANRCLCCTRAAEIALSCF